MTRKKLVITIASVLVLFVAGGSVYYSSHKDKDSEDVQSDAPVDNVTDGQERRKNAKTKPAEKPKTQPVKNTAEITKAWQDTDSSVVVQTKLTGSGFSKCVLIFTKGSAKVEETAEVIYQPEFSTCAGFSVPSSRFSSSGDWRIVLNAIKTDGSTISSKSKNIRINK